MFVVEMHHPYPAILISHCISVVISESVFANFANVHTPEPSILVLYRSSNIALSDCNFVRNTITTLHVVCSHFTVSGIVRFTGNRAHRGGAIVIESGSTMKLSKNGSVFFVDNQANFFGGAIYLEISSDSCSCMDVSHSCFLQLEEYHLNKVLTFVNNSARMGGGVMCAYCLLTSNSISHISPDTLSKLASDPYHVCICSNNTPECSIFRTDIGPIFPGQSVSVSGVIVGREGGTVPGSVFANFLQLHSQLAAEGTQRVYNSTSLQ